MIANENLTEHSFQYMTHKTYHQGGGGIRIIFLNFYHSNNGHIGYQTSACTELYEHRAEKPQHYTRISTYTHARRRTHTHTRGQAELKISPAKSLQRKFRKHHA